MTNGMRCNKNHNNSQKSSKCNQALLSTLENDENVWEGVSDADIEEFGMKLDAMLKKKK